MKRKFIRFRFFIPFFLLSVAVFSLAAYLVGIADPASPYLYWKWVAALLLSLLLAFAAAAWFLYDLKYWRYLDRKINLELSGFPKTGTGDQKEEQEYIAKVYEDMIEELKDQKAQTEKQKQLLNEARNRVEVILSSVPDGVVTINEDGFIYSWNGGAEAITLYNELNTVGSPYPKIMLFTDKKGNPIPIDETPIEECFRTKAIVDRGDLFLRTKLDVDVPVDIKVAPIFDMNGTIVAVVASFRDVTKKREIERMKEDFLAMVTHDLKSPLAAVVGYTNLLLHPKANFSKEQQHEFLNSILGSVKILQFLIDNILESARLESGRIVYQFDDFELSGLMREIKMMFTPIVDSKKINLVVEGDPMWIHGDKEKLREVINNLVSNAVKFTPADGTISIRYVKTQECAVVTVEDTGKGIPADQIGKLFNKFVQVKGEKRGTGLGLYIVKKLLQDHGQYITVESELGRGTKFTFTLGYGKPKESEEQRVPVDRSSKILVVEDNPEVSKLLKYHLEEAGYKVLQAFNGADAVNMIRREKPALITLDYNLPDMNGKEIVDRVKPIKPPILLITANTPAEKDFYDRMMGKPVDEKRLLREVSSLLHKMSIDSVDVLK